MNHCNADALSCLPAGNNARFDRKEEANLSTVGIKQVISQQLNPTDVGLLVKESRKDPGTLFVHCLCNVLRTVL